MVTRRTRLDLSYLQLFNYLEYLGAGTDKTLLSVRQWQTMGIQHTGMTRNYLNTTSVRINPRY